MKWLGSIHCGRIQERPHLCGDASKQQVGDASRLQVLLQLCIVERALARLVQQLLTLQCPPGSSVTLTAGDERKLGWLLNHRHAATSLLRTLQGMGMLLSIYANVLWCS